MFAFDGEEWKLGYSGALLIDWMASTMFVVMLSSWYHLDEFNYSLDVEVDDCALSGARLQKLKILPIVHKHIFSEYCWTACVSQEIKTFFKINIPIRPVCSDCLIRKIFPGSLRKAICKDIRCRLSLGCINTPSSCLAPILSLFWRIYVDADAYDILLSVQKTLPVHSCASFFQTDVIIFRYQKLCILSSVQSCKSDTMRLAICLV